MSCAICYAPAQPGLWFIAGSFAQCRIYSKYLALQILAQELASPASPVLVRRSADRVETEIQAPISAAAALV